MIAVRSDCGLKNPPSQTDAGNYNLKVELILKIVGCEREHQKSEIILHIKVTNIHHTIL